MSEKIEKYLVTAMFNVYDKNGILLRTHYPLNKIFEAFFPRAARNMALAHIQRRASRDFGRGASVKQIGLMKVSRHLKKKKRPGKRAQPKLF